MNYRIAPIQNAELAVLRMDIYECPSDTGSGGIQQIPYTDDGLTETTGKYNRYLTSYRAVGGINVDMATYGPCCWWDDQGWNSITHLRGIMHVVATYQGSGTDPRDGFKMHESFASVTDGSSNTSLFVERHRVAIPRPANADVDMRRNTFWSSVPRNHMYNATPRAATFSAIDFNNCWNTINTSGTGSADCTAHNCARAAGAYHIGGMNVTLGDASVRFISFTIDVGGGNPGTGTPGEPIIGVWGRLCALADGENTVLH